MSVLYFDKTPADESWPCNVDISTSEIIVQYDYAEEAVTYRGVNNGTGHFELSSGRINGKATLHMFPDSRILEGYWVEDGIRGMWRIQLIAASG